MRHRKDKSKPGSSGRRAARKAIRASSWAKAEKQPAPEIPQIQITPTLRQTAKAFIESFWKLDYNEESIDICEVTLHCKSPEQVSAVSAYVEAQELFISGSLPPLPPPGLLTTANNPVPQVRDPRSSAGQGTGAIEACCTVKNLHALHLGLEDLADKLIQTSQSSLPVDPKLLSVLRKFLGAFLDIVSLNIWSANYAGRHGQENEILATHRSALAFASMLTSSVTAPMIRLSIDHDLTVRVNERVREMKVTSKRHLFVLAVLRKRKDFSLLEYGGLYGNSPGEISKEFDTNNRALAKAVGLRGKFWKATPNRRVVDCIEWSVTATQDQLSEFLKDNARDPGKWSIPPDCNAL